MEHTFGAGTRLWDATAPRRHPRVRSGRRRRRAWASAAGLAVAGVLFIGGVVHGGASSPPQQVVVHRGDTLWGIAAAHYPGDDLQYRVTQLESTNHLGDGSLSPGQILILPAP